MTRIAIVPLQESTTGPCACCGDLTHTVRGDVVVDGNHRGAYHVRWSPQRLAEHAEWMLDLGESSSVPREKRMEVALRLRSHRRWPGFMVVDATSTSWGDQVHACGRALSRDEAVGQPIGRFAYAIVDRVMVEDPRVTALVRGLIAAEPPRWRRWLADRRGTGRRARRCTQGPGESASPAATSSAPGGVHPIPALHVGADSEEVARFVERIRALPADAWRTLDRRGPWTGPWPLALASQLRLLWPTWRWSRHWPGRVMDEATLRDSFGRLEPKLTRSGASERALHATWLAFVAVHERRAMPERAFRAYYRAMEAVVPASA